MKNSFHFFDNQAILWTKGELASNNKELIGSPLFREIVDKYLRFLEKHDSPLLDVFHEVGSHEERINYVIEKLKYLLDMSIEEVVDKYPHLKFLLSDKHFLSEFVEKLYNFWRNYERFFVCLSKGDSKYEEKPYRTFNDTISRLNHLVRWSYRDIIENITGDHPVIYRQVSAGFQVGIIAKEVEWECPDNYKNVSQIPLITQVLLYPPLIIDPPMNKRKGQFMKVDSNPLEGIDFEKEEWLCYPAKVGDLIIHIYFHNKFMNLGCSVSNLFDLVTNSEKNSKPDAIYAFGVPERNLEKFESKTVFYEDKEENLFVAAVPGGDEFGYFGYLKKMVLTLHNSIMLKRGRLPVHGAMVNITLKNNKSSNIIILGDTGAGKSESLEAFRILADEYIREMKIIFDDMGSLSLDEEGNIFAYGTETGAFVRLDDLQPGFAFGNIDRSIIMSPQKINARAVLPVTNFNDISKGQKVDYFLYANNYEEISEDNPIIDKLDSSEEALKIFKEGKVMSKGTTATKGIVGNYFANIFGPPQYKELHDEIAEKYFKALFDSGTFVGQLRTRLGIKGFEAEGPREAAKKLLGMISER